jgi:hypothetical protein
MTRLERIKWDTKWFTQEIKGLDCVIDQHIMQAFRLTEREYDKFCRTAPEGVLNAIGENTMSFGQKRELLLFLRAVLNK